MHRSFFIMLIAITDVFALSLPIDGSYDQVIDELRVRGIFISKYTGLKPYSTHRLDLSHRNLAGVESWLLARVNRDVPFLEARWVSDTTNTTRLKVNLFYENDNLAFLIQPVFKMGKDSLHPRRVFKDLVAADYERAYITVFLGNFDLLIGRERVSIGLSPYDNLILSGKGIPLDLIMGSYDSGLFRITMLFSRLNDIYDKIVDFIGDTTGYKTSQLRYITIKRLDLSLRDIFLRLGLQSLESTNAITFGLSDACVFGGEDVFPDLFYLNPLTIGYISQWTRGDDSNTLLCIDSRVDLNNFGFYVQWLIDDFQYSEDENGEPNHTGWNLGIQLVDPLGLKKTFFMTEYTRVSRWTYTYFRPAGRYNYDGLPLGHSSGPDFDKLSLYFIYHLNEKIDIASDFDYKRKGETRLKSLWPIPEMPRVPGTYFPENNFLSGVVENTSCVSFGLRYDDLPRISIDSKVRYTRINNFRNVEDKEKFYWGIELSVLLSI